MSDLPPLFDKRGAFLPLADDVLASLSPERQELYAAVADAAADMERANAELEAAIADVKLRADLVRDAEKAMPKPPTHVQLVKEMIASNRVARHAASQ
jgi:hypothetical protein